MDPEKIDQQLFHRGAEADLFLSRLGPWKVVVKKRIRKNYRTIELDNRIRTERTAREASMLHDARRAGVRTPTMLSLDPEKCSITMTHVAGYLARDGLDSLGPHSSARVFLEIGRQVGLLHSHGIIHGDLTTSNIIVADGDRPFLLDFGMSSYSMEVEDRGVDLHLLQRSIVTSHAVNSKRVIKEVKNGYVEAVGERNATLSFRKEGEIARRGRYFAFR